MHKKEIFFFRNFLFGILAFWQDGMKKGFIAYKEYESKKSYDYKETFLIAKLVQLRIPYHERCMNIKIVKIFFYFPRSSKRMDSVHICIGKQAWLYLCVLYTEYTYTAY